MIESILSQETAMKNLLAIDRSEHGIKMETGSHLGIGEKVDSEAIAVDHLHLTDLQEETVVFHLTVRKEKAVFLKEHRDVQTLQDHQKHLEQDAQEKTKLFS